MGEPLIELYTAQKESGGEAHQSAQAIQAGGDPLREASGELRGDAEASSDQDLAMICKQTLVRLQVVLKPIRFS